MSDFVTVEKDDGTLMLEKYTGYDDDIVVPDGISEISISAFQYPVKSIVIPDSIKHLESNSFYGFGESLANEKGLCIAGKFLINYIGNDSVLTVPEGIKEISFCAVAGNNYVKKVILPSTIEKIGNQAFCRCDSLEEVEIAGGGQNLKVIDHAAFSGCSSLRRFDMPDKPVSTGIGAFNECINLKRDGDFKICGSLLINCYSNEQTIIVPDGIISVGSEAFRGCTNTMKVVLPKGLELIGDSAFAFLNQLYEVDIPESVQYIMNSAFICCNKLKTADIKNVKYIGEKAFCGCSGLEVVSQPEKAETIGKEAFCGCKAIKQISLPNSLKILGSEDTKKPEAFESRGVFEDSELEQISIPGSISVIEYNAFKGSDLIEVTIPDSIKTIGEYAFCNCSKLESVIIPESVSEIGYNAFLGCPKLNNISLPKTFPRDYKGKLGLSDENGCIIEGKSLIRCDSINGAATVTEGVEIIPEDAFCHIFRRWGGNDPSKVILPDTVKRIDVTFFGRDTDINIPDGYLQQRTKLPIKATITLLDGPWKTHATKRDYACLYLFQTGEQLQNRGRQELDQDAEETVKLFIDILKPRDSINAYKKATGFILENKDRIGHETILGFYNKAKEDKADAAADSLKPYIDTGDSGNSMDSSLVVESGRKDSKNSLELFCEKKYVPFLFTEFLKKKKVSEKLFKTVKYKDSEEHAPVFVVECAVVPYMQQLDEVPRKIGDYKKDFPKFRIDSDADKVAEALDPISFSEMLDAFFEKKLPSNYQVFVPYGRFASSMQIQELISRMGEWREWYQYGSSGRIAIMVARGAILLNESDDAFQYAKKSKLAGSYADIHQNSNKGSDMLANPQIDFFTKREADINEVDFAKKTIEIGEIETYVNADEDQYYGNLGTPFDVAKTVLEYYGAKTTVSVSGRTDYVLFSKHMDISNKRDERFINDDFASYCEHQTIFKRAVNEGDKKRKAKGLPKIQAIPVDAFYVWLREQYEKLKDTTELFKPYGRIEILFWKDCGGGSYKFKSEHFASISEEQMQNALSGISSFSEFVSNIERITKAGAFAESGTASWTYENMLQSDEDYKFSDYSMLTFSFEASNGMKYSIRVK